MEQAKNPQQLYSHHVFMFPFKWEHTGKATLKDKFDLDNLAQLLGPQWQRKPFALNHERYNEYTYFHPYVREVMYDHGPTSHTPSSMQKASETLIHHFEYKLGNDNPAHYCIQIAAEKTFTLTIESILLNMYSTGTGVLSFHLRNFTHQNADDVLLINQRGRRLYPPFFNLSKASTISGQPDETTGNALLEDTKGSELPEAITLKGVVPGAEVVEAFDWYLKAQNLNQQAVRLPKYIRALFPDGRIIEPPNFAAPQTIHKNKTCIRPVIDDRMFVACWYGNNDLIAKLKANNADHNTKAYISSEWWHRYIMVDGQYPTVANAQMLAQLNQDHTYARWVDWGTLYGITKYSLVMLTSELTPVESGGGVPDFLVRHLQTMYYKMAELALVQRATVLSYADEVTHVSDLINNTNIQKETVLDRIQGLYKYYILFINKVYFREVSPQEQGIEMYNLLQKHMQLDRDVKNLDQEISELHQYAKLEADQRNNRLLFKISFLGFAVLPFTLLMSLFGLPSPPHEWLSCLGLTSIWSRFILVIVISAITSFLLIRYWLNKAAKH